MKFTRVGGAPIDCNLHSITVHHLAAKGISIGEIFTSESGDEYEVVGFSRQPNELANMVLELRRVWRQIKPNNNSPQPQRKDDAA